MNVYYCYHRGITIGGNSVIVAKDKKQARKLLNEELAKLDLQPYTGDFVKLDIENPNAVVLFDGEY